MDIRKALERVGGLGTLGETLQNLVASEMLFQAKKMCNGVKMLDMDLIRDAVNRAFDNWQKELEQNGLTEEFEIERETINSEVECLAAFQTMILDNQKRLAEKYGVDKYHERARKLQEYGDTCNRRNDQRGDSNEVRDHNPGERQTDSSL